MEKSKFQIAIKPKGLTPIKMEYVFAKDLKDAENKAENLIDNFKTSDKRLKQCIEDCGGLETVVTQLN